ncbi:MAG: tetratricopeptide repeat protein, partial [Nitrospirae bacterium]
MALSRNPRSTLLRGLATLFLLVAACSREGGEAELRYRRAGHLLEAGKPGAAVVELKAALERRPDWAPAERRLGRAYLALGRYEKARAALARAAELAPENPEVVLDLAEAEIHLDRLEEAEAHLERYARAVGRTARYLRLRGELAQRRGDPAAARGHLEAALAADPDSVPARLDLARLAVAEDDLEEAARQLQEAARRRPEDLEVQYGLAEVAIRRGEFDEANQILDRIGKIDDRQVLSRLLKVETLLRAHEDAQALAAATSLVQERPDLARAHLLKGLLLLRGRRLEDAVAALTRAATLDPQDPAAPF